MSEVVRCHAAVYHRDAYRYTGRVKGGFEMHYICKQCRRRAVAGERYCRQHLNMAAHMEMLDPSWATDKWPPSKYE